jgi:hypothetical protein
MVASLLALVVPLATAPSAISAAEAEINGAQSVNLLRSSDGGDSFKPQSLDNAGSGVGQVTQVASEDGTVHALFGSENNDDDFAFPFELYHRRSTDGGRQFDEGRRLDDDEGISSEPSLATSVGHVHVAYEENRLEFGVDNDTDDPPGTPGDPDEDEVEDEFPEEVYYTRSANEGRGFDGPRNLSGTVFAQERDNDVTATGSRVAVVYESAQLDPEEFDVAPTIPEHEQTTGDDIVIRVSDDNGATFADHINLTFDGTTDGPFAGDDLATQRQDQPKVGLSGDGDDDAVLVVFRVRTAEDTALRIGSVHSTDGGRSFGPIRLLPSDVDVDDLPALYMNGDDAHILACDVENRLLHWHSGNAGGQFSGPRVVSAGAERCAKPAIDGAGNDLHVAFLRDVAGEPDVFHVHSDDGGADWNAPRNLTANHNQGEFPAIAVDDDDVHVVWQDVSDFLFSVKYGDSIPEADGDDRHFANEDVIRYHGSTYQMVLDGSDVGLRNLRIDAMAVVEPADPGEPERYLLSFTEKARVPGIDEKVDDSDVVLFTPTSLGDDTDGTFELFFDGSAIGLDNAGEDINSIEVIDTDLYFSTEGRFKLSGEYDDLAGKNEDIFVCREATSTSCADGAEIVVDGSSRELAGSGENVDAFAFDPEDGNAPGSKAFFSTSGDFKTDTARGKDRDFFSCVFPEFDDELDPEPTPTNFDGDITDCGGKFSPFATTFLGSVNRLSGDITSLDVQFPV